jgi:hypothetical protein
MELIKVFEILAEGGRITLKARQDDGEWKYAVFINEAALDDEGGGVSNTPFGSWEDAGRRLERYPWPEMHVRYVHPDYKDRVRALAEGHPLRRPETPPSFD